MPALPLPVVDLRLPLNVALARQGRLPLTAFPAPCSGKPSGRLRAPGTVLVAQAQG